MKLLILSDSHGALEPMARAVRQVKPDAVIHLGDCVPDAKRLQARFSDIPVYYVAGNNDPEDSAAQSLTLTLAGVTLLAVHGHRHSVRSGLLRLEYAAREAGAALALYGHTHIPDCQQLGDLWIVNPGACGQYHPTFALAEIENGKISCYNASVSPSAGI